MARRPDHHALGIGEKLIFAAVRAPDGDFRSPGEIADWAGHIACGLREPAPVA